MKNLCFFLSFLLFTRGHPFLLGPWKILGFQDISFQVDEKHVVSHLEKGGIIRMKHNLCFASISTLNHSKEDNFFLELNTLEIVKRPSDWYNFPKYRNVLPLFHKIKKEKILLSLQWQDGDTLIVKPKIGTNESFEPFILYREMK